MVVAQIWPFDWSCSGLLFLGVLSVSWVTWSAASAARKAAEAAARKTMQSKTAKEVGKNMLEAWIVSWFHR